MYYCVSSAYKAGGCVDRKIYPIHSKDKPKDAETEDELNFRVWRYFDTKEEANKYCEMTLR